MRRVCFRCTATYAGSTNDMIDELTSYIKSMDTTEQQQNTTINSTEDTLEAGLFFVDTPVRFHFKDNRVTMVVDSTMSGPGYHVAMVYFMEYMEISTSITWDKSTLHDDTGYCQHRDMNRLKKYMSDWLIEYSQSLIDDPNLVLPVRTNLIMPYAMLPEGNEYFACHALGYVHKDFFTFIKELEDPEPFCRAFFIWWDYEMNAEFYLKCALSNIWCRINWLPPVLEEEIVDINNVIQELETAWQMDKTLPFPVPEWIEIAKISQDEELARELIKRFPTEINQPPSKGYRRHDILHILGESTWTIKLPGKMHKTFDEDGALIFWDYQYRNIRILTTRGTDASGNPVPAMDILKQSIAGTTAKPHLLPSDISIPAFIEHEELKLSGKDMYATTLFAAVDGKEVIVNIYYADQTLRPWAMSVCNSLTPL